MPTWTDPGLPLTHTSSHKIMAKELDAHKTGTALKRKAEEEADRSVCMPVKKARLGSMKDELRKMREGAEEEKQQQQQRQRRESMENGGQSSTIRDAMQHIDTLIRTAADTERQNAALETLLLTHEARCVQDADEIFDQWLAYNRIKKGEMDRVLDGHVAELRGRDARIKLLEADVQGWRGRFWKERRKVRARDGRLERVRGRWVEERKEMDGKVREMREFVMGLEEVSDFDDDVDEDEEEKMDDEDEDADFKTEDEKEDKQQEERTTQPQQCPRNEAAGPDIPPAKESQKQEKPNDNKTKQEHAKQESLNNDKDNDEAQGTPISQIDNELQEVTDGPTATRNHKSNISVIVQQPLTDVVPEENVDFDVNSQEEREEDNEEEEEEEEEEEDEVFVSRTPRQLSARVRSSPT